MRSTGSYTRLPASRGKAADPGEGSNEETRSATRVHSLLGPVASLTRRRAEDPVAGDRVRGVGGVEP